MDFLARIRRTQAGDVVVAKGDKLQLPNAKGKIESLNLAKLSKDELIEVIKDIVADWNTLNDLHNGRARDEGWCSTYESNQAHYNTKFRRMRLRGRHNQVRTNESAGDCYARGDRERHRLMYGTFPNPYGDHYGSNRRTL